MPNIESIVAGFDARKNNLLTALLVPPSPTARPGDIYGNFAAARLLQNVDVDAANLRLQHVAQWFEHPHPWGRDHLGEPDFVAQKLAFVYLKLHGSNALAPATSDAIRRFFLTTNFQSKYHSENHDLIFRAMRYLMASALPDETFAHWKLVGRELVPGDLAWLKSFLRYRAAHGWAEFDSACYMLPDVEALLALHDLAHDAELTRLCEMSLNLMLADMAVDSLNGFHGGAQGRIYPPHATDHSTTGAFLFNHLYFGNVDAAQMHTSHTPVELFATRFRPHPLVIELALNRSKPYLNFERKHLHNMADVMPAKPIDGSIRKLTCWTPDFILGAVQRQDEYPADVPQWSRVYAFHQQHDWDLSFPTNPKARLFTHHPGNFDQHNHWTGDQKCGCGRFFQHGSALVALYHIPESEPFRFIHAYVPRAAFDELIEEAGWIFVRAGDGYAGLKLLSGYRWITDGDWAGAEVQSPAGDGREGVVCEAGRASEFGNFASFRSAVRANAFEFDTQAMTLTYRSARNGTLTIGPGTQRKINGAEADLDYPTYRSPHLNSPWGSGVVQLTTQAGSLEFNFPAATMRAAPQTTG